MQTALQSSSSYSVPKSNTDELWRAASTLAAGGVDSLATKFMPAMLLQKDQLVDNLYFKQSIYIYNSHVMPIALVYLT